ncbi:MAG: hypothetical protein EA411_10515 [Saprospirales bacterium]|nr:MAG: hypothetical protein EA411_10515 [Saprospirales bacterium]
MGFFGLRSDIEKLSVKSIEPGVDYSGGVDGDPIFSYDKNYFLGSIFYDEDAEMHVVSVNTENAKAHLASKHGRGHSFDSLTVVKNHLYLYFNKGSKIFAQDVNLGSRDWVNSDLKFGYAGTHSCDAECVSTAICESCSFMRDNGKIVDCNCDQSSMVCCHTIKGYSFGYR